MQEQASSRLHPLWHEVTALNGRTFCFNPFTGRVSQGRFEAPAPVQGGILSDEASLLHLCSTSCKSQAMSTDLSTPSTGFLQLACSHSLTMFATQQHVTLPCYKCNPIVSIALVMKRLCSVLAVICNAYQQSPFSVLTGPCAYACKHVCIPTLYQKAGKACSSQCLVVCRWG